MTADELRTLIQQLPPIEGADTWANHRRAIRQHILTEDIESFMEWSTISATMHVGNAPFIVEEYEALKPEWNRWMEAIRWTGFGSDTFHSGNGYASDTNLIHQAYHLSQWERVTGKQVKKLDRVIEFGGGYGAMCLLCKRLGFEGSYWIEDFPELSYLQEYYLGTKVDTSRVYYGWQYRYKCDLFIASHSLSEIPIEERHRILNGLDTDSFLFIFHCQHNEVDNLEWFSQLAIDNPKYEWTSWYTEHLPNQWYQIGIKR